LCIQIELKKTAEIGGFFIARFLLLRFNLVLELRIEIIKVNIFKRQLLWCFEG